MGSAWQGDWAARINDFVKGRGNQNIWDFLLAHPAIPLREIADMIGDAAPVQIERLATGYCAGQNLLPDLVRDLVSRSINRELPGGWGTGNDFKHVMAVGGTSGLPSPYCDLSFGTYLLKVSPPPSGWLPGSGDDEHLIAAYNHALASLSAEKRNTIECGGIEAMPGDAYRAAIAPVWKSIDIYHGPDDFLRRFAEVRIELGALVAAHWCQSEICNGGFHQFFHNPTGVLAPEAARGFAAIGISSCADLLHQAMRFFGNSYPREREIRVAKLDALPGETRAECDPFYKLDDPFYAALREHGGFAIAADAYASKIVRSDT